MTQDYAISLMIRTGASKRVIRSFNSKEAHDRYCEEMESEGFAVHSIPLKPGSGKRRVRLNNLKIIE